MRFAESFAPHMDCLPSTHLTVGLDYDQIPINPSLRGISSWLRMGPMQLIQKYLINIRSMYIGGSEG